MWAIGLFLFLLGIILVIVAPIGKKKNARCSEQVPAVLRDVREKRGDDDMVSHIYTFSYTVDGTEYKLVTSANSSGASEIGDNCTLWYNPKKPSEALTAHYESAKLFNILLIVGIVMIPLGLVLMLVGTM